MSWSAFIDESMRQRRDGTGIYVLAAGIVDMTENVDHARSALRALVPRNQRFHWRDEKPAGRMRAVNTITALSAMHVVVVGTSLKNPKQERGRRKCLENLLWHLQDAGVTQAWLEARTPSLNAHDMLAVQAFRSHKTVLSDLHVNFIEPWAEPLAWLPDIVAGAVSAARGDGNERYLEPLIPILTEHTLKID